MVIKAARAATAVRKPASTFIPRMAALLAVGVVLVSELVLDATGVVGVTAILAKEVEVVPIVMEELVEDVVELMLNSEDWASNWSRLSAFAARLTRKAEP